MSSAPSTARRGRRAQQSRACLACQKRKSRCKREPEHSSSKCIMCRFHGTECLFASDSKDPPQPPRTAKPQAPFPHVQRTPFPRPSGSTGTDEDEMHIVGPVNSADTRLIADYISNTYASGFLVGGSNTNTDDAAPVHVMGHCDPVMFNTVRRTPLGTTKKESTASAKCLVVEHVIGLSSSSHLVDVYFDKVHICFPLLDKDSFTSQYASSKESLSPSLLACLYANAAVYGRNSTLLPAQWCPDITYMWNQASEALYSELHLAPSISIIIAILLNISGRPLTTIIGNGILLGSAVAIGHALGLNRNCMDWDIPGAEKCLRTRLWWAIFIFDKWSSVAYGTPSHLKQTEHDVPAPSLATLYETVNGPENSGAAFIFIHLITLTQVLDTYLEYIFCLQQKSSPMLFNGDNKLIEWEDSLPQEIRRIVLRGVDLREPGSSNLRMTYLYVKLLDRRLEADRASQQAFLHENPIPNRLIQARGVAEEIVSLVQELNCSSISDFWLPLCAFVLSNTVAFLLRCTLEIEHHQVGLAKSVSLKLAAAMIEALRSHRQQFGWDIGDICLTQYAEITEKLATSQIQVEEALQQFRPTMVANATNIDDTYLNLWEFAC